MKLLSFFISIIIPVSFFSACSDNAQREKESSPLFPQGTYGYDKEFMKSHHDSILELRSSDGNARILLSAAYQGRVMTSTSTGDSGKSYGWINYDLITEGEWKKQFNPVGGEERFWLGPEGGQYALYFQKGDSMNFKNWQVPGLIDTAIYEVVSHSDAKVSFYKKGKLTNYSGAEFDVEIFRDIKLVEQTEVEEKLGVKMNQANNLVAYETNNRVTNVGTNRWNKNTGLISIWLLGMFTPSDDAVIIIPFKKEGRNEITTDYFGHIPQDRLSISDSTIMFRGDGKHRGKIGLSPLSAYPYAMSYDVGRQVFTMIFFNIDSAGNYVNSKWENQQFPYKGDVLNAYNDGPVEGGDQLGPFYELESSSPAKELAPGERVTHKQMTIHIEGNEPLIDSILKNAGAPSISAIKAYLKINNR